MRGGAPPPRRRKKRKKTRPAGSAKGPVPRCENLRHFRHQESEASRGGANLPRIAHAYLGGRSERQRQCLYLRVGHVVCAAAGRTGWMLRGKTGQRAENNPVSNRRDQGAYGWSP